MIPTFGREEKESESFDIAGQFKKKHFLHELSDLVKLYYSCD